MPLTELVVVIAAFAACCIGLICWVGACIDRPVEAHVGMGSAWHRIAHHPALAVATCLPVLLALGLLATRAALLQGH